MDLVFKFDAPKTYDTATVGDSDFKRFYPEVNINTLWSEIAPYIGDATEKYIVPYIGATLYDDIAAKYQAGTTLNATETKILNYLKKAVAYYTIVYGYPKKLDIITSVGNVQDNVQNATATPQWAFRQKLYDLTRSADGHLDILMNYLESVDQLIDNKAAPFFRTLGTFEMYHDLNGSHFTFRSLRNSITDALNQFIIPQVGAAMINELKTQYAANTLTSANIALLGLVRQALAKYAVALACDMPAYTVDGSYLFALSNTEGFDARSQTQQKNRETLDRMASTCKVAGDKYREALVNYLYINADTYPTWKTEKYPTDTAKKQTIITSDDGIGGIML